MAGKYRYWLWPAVVVASAALAAALALGGARTPLRPYAELWFLSVCPGMALVHPLRLGEIYIRLSVAVALSIAIDAIVATLVLYAALWSPGAILVVLIGISLGGIAIDGALAWRRGRAVGSGGVAALPRSMARIGEFL